MDDKRTQYVSHAEFTEFRNSDDRWKTNIEKMLEQIRRDGRFPVSIVLTMIGLVAAAIVFVVSSQTNPNAEKIAQLTDAMQAHIDTPGHPEALVTIAGALKDIQRIDGDVLGALQEIKDLDTNLQREMRDLDQVQTVRIDSLDERLQREMRDLIEPMASAIKANTDDLASRAGHRFNMPDYERLVEPMMLELRQRLIDIERTRSTADQRQRLLDEIADLRERLARVEERENVD